MQDLDRVITAVPAAAGVGRLNQTPAPTPEQIRTLAAQFESLLLGQMLKQMRASLFDDGKDTGFADGPLSDTVYAELSLALSRAGGIGVADALLAPMMRQAEAAGEGPAAVPEGSPVALPPGRISSRYGWRRDPIDGDARFHAGLDIAMPVGRDVPVARAGQVTFAGELPGYGLTVVVAHDDRISTRYAHLSELSVTQGQTVEAGQVIARSGATGRATGPHLHFEVLDGGRRVDPLEPRGFSPGE